MAISDPFRRNKSPFLIPHLKGDYKGQEGLEALFEAASPHVLLRTDPNLKCVCSSSTSSSGKEDCTRCFGTGKVIKSLDRFSAYISNSSPDRINNLGSQGVETADTRIIYSGRWVRPSMGDLVLEVGWDVPNREVYFRGQVKRVDNVYLIKQVNFIGFSEVSYIESFTIMANTRKKYIQNILLYGMDLPEYRNSLKG